MRIICEELAPLGLSPAPLVLPAGSGAARLRATRRLRQETTMSLRWIGERLGFGSWKYLSNLLAQEPKDDPRQPGLGI